MTRFALTVLAIALAAAPAWADSKPATQPDATAVAPATQPELAALRPSGLSISFLLTRNLPQLSPQQVALWHGLNSGQKAAVTEGFRMLGRLKNDQAELERMTRAKQELDQAAPDKKERYLQQGLLIQQVLDKLPPQEKARLLALPKEERAKELRRLIAEFKAQQLKDAATGHKP